MSNSDSCVCVKDSSPAEDYTHNTVHWFRKDLRLHDNPALREALANSKEFYGVYFLDPEAIKQSRTSPNRVIFLLQCLQDLDLSLRELGSRLFVIRGHPIKEFPKLFKKWGITRLSFEVDSEPFNRQRDAVLTQLAEHSGIQVITQACHTLFDIEEVIAHSGGNPPLVFNDFIKLVAQLGPPKEPAEKPGKALLGSCTTPVTQDHDDKYGVPSVVELGLQESEMPFSVMWRGGEMEALQRMDVFLQQVCIVWLMVRIIYIYVENTSSVTCH